jgi:hypothetical protein
MSNKAREALLAVYDCAKDGVLTIRESAFEKVVEALAEPILNRDVGTADDQVERFCAFCDSHTNEDGQHCNDCPIYNMPAEADCLLVWLQMPYDETKGEKK